MIKHRLHNALFLSLLLVFAACTGNEVKDANVLVEMSGADRFVAGTRLTSEQRQVDSESEELIKAESEQDTLLSSDIFTQTCCNGKDIGELIDCCAPIVLEYYEQILAEGQWDKISNLSSGDEVFNKLRYHRSTSSSFVTLEEKYLSAEDDDDWN